MTKRGTYAKGDARRAEILDATRRMIEEQGYHQATLRGIGRTLGIETAHILYYFPSREALMREVISRWDDASAHLSAPGSSPLDLYSLTIRGNSALRGVVQAYLAFSAEALDRDHSAHDYFRERFDDTREKLAGAIRSRQQEGLILPSVDADRASRMLIALADGLQLQSLMGSPVDAAADVDAAIADLYVSPELFRAGERS